VNAYPLDTSMNASIITIWVSSPINAVENWFSYVKNAILSNGIIRRKIAGRRLNK
jgi:hypothetical protein